MFFHCFGYNAVILSYAPIDMLQDPTQRFDVSSLALVFSSVDGMVNFHREFLEHLQDNKSIPTVGIVFRRKMPALMILGIRMGGEGKCRLMVSGGGQFLVFSIAKCYDMCVTVIQN